MRQLRYDGSPRPAGRTDFGRALTSGASFESVEGLWHVRPVPAGELVLPSGRIIATDPCYLARPGATPPFVRTVPPGCYPVWLALARKGSDAPWAERVACMVLQLSDGPAVQWAPALRPGERLVDLPPGHCYGHGVDSGNACFVDAAAIAGLDPAMIGALYTDGVVGAYEHAGWRTRFVHVPIPGSSAANLIACASGYGDGFYPSWWGINETSTASRKSVSGSDQRPRTNDQRRALGPWSFVLGPTPNGLPKSSTSAPCALATDFFVLVEEIDADGVCGL